METYANGSAQLNFGPTHLNHIKLACPPKDLALKYEKLMSPIEEEIKIIRDKIIYLNEMREIILPRILMEIIKIDKINLD